MCFHKFVDGFGGMGDAVVCVKCGLDKYPEVMPLLITVARLSGNYIENDDTYMSFTQYPFIRKFDKKINYRTKHTDWTHAFNKRGKLVPKEQFK